MVDSLFFSISALFGITVVMAFVMRLLRQPLIIAYLLSGIVAGPFLFNLIGGQHEFFDTFAHFGIVLLLFAVGLSLDFSYLKKIGSVALITGVGQFLFTSIIGYGLIWLLGWSVVPALCLAVAMTFSSTIIIVKLLSDKKDTQSVYGRYTIGLMLVQDIIAVGILILLPAFAQTGNWLLIFGLFLAKGLGILAATYLVARVVIPFVVDKIADSGEFLFIFTIAWCFGVAGLVHVLGLSLEIGAIVAGVSLGSSIYQAEIVSKIKPLRDFFIVLFFIILGSEISLAGLALAWQPGLLLALFVLVGNPFILFVLFRALHFSRRNSFLAGVTAGQVSEFGFVLLFLAQNLGYVGDRELTVFTVIGLATIFVSSYLITYNEKIYHFLRPLIHRFFDRDLYARPEEKIQDYEVWLFGYHRMGWKIAHALTKNRQRFAVVDYDPEAIKKLQSQNIPAFFGDAFDIEFLSELPLTKAKIIISTIPNVEDQRMLIDYVRRVNKTAVVICTLYYPDHLAKLYQAGANYVMLPHFLGGQWLADLLKNKKTSKATLQSLRRQQNLEMLDHAKILNGQL